jgi:hypothetical protein
MQNSNNTSRQRRTVLKTTVLGMLGLSIPGIAVTNTGFARPYGNALFNKVPEHFPHIDPEIVSEVVGKSHSDLEGVKKLVDKRPELARSVWEWRFGDFESAIGAASHVGRRDIVQYLMGNGARPTIFTFGMMGSYEVVKSMIDSYPGIQKTMGPHGISLLDHAYIGDRMKDKMTREEIDDLKRTISYLESLGDASGEKYLDVSPEEQKKYLGDYRYGDAPQEGFTVQINMRELLSLAPIGGFGGALYRLDDHTFTYNGTPSVRILFLVEKEKVKSLSVQTPEAKITALKV